MRLSTIKTIGRLVLVVALCAGSSLAQRGVRRGGMAGRVGASSVTKEDVVELFVALLDLGDSQKQQLSTILDGAVQTAGSIQAQLDKGEQSLFETAKSGKSDSEIDKLADQQGSLISQMLSLQARSFAKICGMLNSDQQTKVDSFLYERIESLLTNPINPAGIR